MGKFKLKNQKKPSAKKADPMPPALKNPSFSIIDFDPSDKMTAEEKQAYHDFCSKNDPVMDLQASFVLAGIPVEVIGAPPEMEKAVCEVMIRQWPAAKEELIKRGEAKGHKIYFEDLDEECQRVFNERVEKALLETEDEKEKEFLKKLPSLVDPTFFHNTLQEIQFYFTNAGYDEAGRDWAMDMMTVLDYRKSDYYSGFALLYCEASYRDNQKAYDLCKEMLEKETDPLRKDAIAGALSTLEDFLKWD